MHTLHLLLVCLTRSSFATKTIFRDQICNQKTFRLVRLIELSSTEIMIKAKYDVTRPVNLSSVDDVNKWTHKQLGLFLMLFHLHQLAFSFPLLCDSLVASEHHTSL